MHLGFIDEGHLTTYYPDSPEITKDEIGAVATWSQDKGLLPENNRLRKTKDGVFEILIASATSTVPAEGGDIGKDTEFTVSGGLLDGKTIKLVYGDYAPEMGAITGFISMLNHRLYGCPDVPGTPETFPYPETALKEE